MENRLMSLEEKWKLLDAIHDAEQAGDRDTAYLLMMKIPLAPGMAKIGKEMYGKGFLVENGYDLSEANAEFGNGWLDR